MEVQQPLRLWEEEQGLILHLMAEAISNSIKINSSQLAWTMGVYAPRTKVVCRCLPVRTPTMVTMRTSTMTCSMPESSNASSRCELTRN